MQGRPRLKAARGISLAGLMLLIAACATPVGVRGVDTQTGYRVNAENALSAGRVSAPSKAVLRRAGLLNRFERDPVTVLAELHRGVGSLGDDDRLFALAELSFLHAESSGDRAYFLAAAVYAYALLFPGEGAGTSLDPSDPRLRVACDLYNTGLAKALATPRETAGTSGGVLAVTIPGIELAPGTRPLPFGQLELDVDPSGLRWGGYRLEQFVSTATLEVRGLRNHYRRPGLGASFAASLAKREASSQVIGSERIAPRTKVPVTVLMRVEDVRASLTRGQVHAHLEVYAADQTASVTIDGRSLPLEFDPTAALAFQLENSPSYDVELRGFFRGDVLRRLAPSDRAQDGLAMLTPYRPGKIPVVLVHGTASSPARWAELTNELQGDPRIMQRYQIWFFIYDSGNPIPYSAGRLCSALSAAVQGLDPEGSDPALQRMVLIGHSQGGLLAKLTVIDSGTRFWDNLTSKPFDSIEVTPGTRKILQQSLFFKPLPLVRRVIFVATPQRGAATAQSRIGALAARLVKLPATMVGQLSETVSAIGDEKLAAALKRPVTAVDNMNPSNPFVRTLASIPVPPQTPAHSIIAVKGNGPKEDGSDGVVTYRSAHIDEAVSELVVHSGHSVQANPEAIEEIRRILLEHAAMQASTRQ